MNNAQDPNTKSDCILILDFGLQHSQLIARRIREIGVYAELHAYDITQEQIREYNQKALSCQMDPTVPMKQCANRL